jgi:cell division protein ZapA (FtsZ GTPase activity inhibitor)
VFEKQLQYNNIRPGTFCFERFEDEQVAEVVQFLNKKVDEILHSGNGLKTLNVAILAALNISEEFLKLKKLTKSSVTNWKTGPKN